MTHPSSTTRRDTPGAMPAGTLVALGRVLARRRPASTSGLPWKDDHSNVRYTNDEIETLIRAGAAVAYPGEELPPTSETTLDRVLAARNLFCLQREALRDAVLDLLAAADKVFADDPDARTALEHARTRGFAALRAMPPKVVTS